MTIKTIYDRITLFGDAMNINRINFISQFVVPLIENNKVEIKKEQEHFKVTEVTASDSHFDRDQQHDPMYFYELMKNQHHVNIKDVSDEQKNR